MPIRFLELQVDLGVIVSFEFECECCIGLME
jgi:hypothetical protein